jgi:hypothetical protein
MNVDATNIDITRLMGAVIMRRDRATSGRERKKYQEALDVLHAIGDGLWDLRIGDDSERVDLPSLGIRGVALLTTPTKTLGPRDHLNINFDAPLMPSGDYVAVLVRVDR